MEGKSLNSEQTNTSIGRFTDISDKNTINPSSFIIFIFSKLPPYLVSRDCLHKYLSQNWDSDGHFEVLNGSVSQLVKKLCHKTHIFFVSGFYQFCKKARQNDAIIFFSNHHGQRY